MWYLSQYLFIAVGLVDGTPELRSPDLMGSPHAYLGELGSLMSVFINVPSLSE